MRRLHLLGLGLVTLAAVACSGTSATSGGGGPGGEACQGAECTGSPRDEGAKPGVGGKGCDPSVFSLEPACIHESWGVFVSSSKGSPGGDGTRARPLDSLTKAIAMAQRDQKRVYACAETYAEQVAISPGVSMFGNFDCATWSVAADHRAKIAASLSPSVTADGIAKPTRFEGFEVVGPDRSQSVGESSIAMIARHSPSLEIVNSVLMAQGGGAGRNGVAGPTVTQASTQIFGSPGANQTWCGANELFCPSVARGGAGGISDCRVNGQPMPALQGAAGEEGGRGAVNEVRPGFRGNFLALRAAAEAGSGAAGADGAYGTPGTNGASFGSVTEAGYVPADGTNGGNGKGGGGGSRGGGIDVTSNPGQFEVGDWVIGASGGGGGAGGCGGVGGTGGAGGGASIALIVWEGPLQLRGVTLRTGRGGDGGEGAYGSPGTPGGGGGAPGTAPPSVSAGAGGRGGSGGAGAPGGHGGGGPSIGIVVKGAAVVRDKVSFEIGTGGKGPRGSIDRPAGTDGVATEIKELP